MATQKVVVEGSSGVTASQLKDFFRQIEDGSIDGAYLQSVLDHCTADKPTLPVVAQQPKPPTLVLLKTTELGEVEGKKTSDCLTGDLWAYRDNSIDGWLPAKQPKCDFAAIGVYQLQNPEGTTLREMAAAVLKVGPSTSLDLFAKALKEQGHTLTLQQVERMVEMEECGEDVGLRTDGWANFAFVEDANGSVSVLRVRRRGGRWRAGVYRLDNGYRWHAEYRLLLRNSVASVL
ncbi:MAG: hypothetical protein AAB449_00715 [Patescibacteria group bacterium]